MTFETVLPIPDILSARRILCIQPHQDDNDIAAAGTLALLRQAEAEIFYLTVTDGLKGVVKTSLSDTDAAQALQRDQLAAGKIIGVKEQYWLDYPDAGEYSYFDLRRDLLKYIRLIQPDFIFTADPWLTYEGHRDHIQTGLAATEAVIFSRLTKIASSDPAVDAAYPGHTIQGIAYYYTREPNVMLDLTAVWEMKRAAIRCYETQIEPGDMDVLNMALDIKSRQITAGISFEWSEPLKVLHPKALHCGL
jgi:LmbE family N-acetylglucosaminyl deacetylase